MTLTEKEIAVRNAERELETTKKKSASQLLQKEVAVQQSEKRVDRLKRSIEEKKEDITNMTMEAPCPGFVLYGDPREPWYSERIKIGGNVWEGTTLMTIPDLRVMLVKLAVHEADITKVKEGQKATITMDTYPGSVLHGKVTKVAQIAAAKSPWQSGSDVKKFDVEITVESTGDLKLKPGISAKAEIQIDRREDVLYVPIQSVFLSSGTHYCRVQEGDGIEQRKVEVGKSSDQYIEVVSGLTEDDRVLLYNPNLPDGGKSEDEENEVQESESAGQSDTDVATPGVPE